MTDLSADVRIVAEWLGWNPCEDGKCWLSPRGLHVLLGKHKNREHFVAHILDKLERNSIPYSLSFQIDGYGERECEFSIIGSPAVARFDGDRAEAIVRATAAWRRAEGGEDV